MRAPRVVGTITDFRLVFSLFVLFTNCVSLSLFELIQVVSSTGDEVFFKIKRSTKLSKLQGAYANKVGKDVNSIRCVSTVFFPPSTFFFFSFSG